MIARTTATDTAVIRAASARYGQRRQGETTADDVVSVYCDTVHPDGGQDWWQLWHYIADAVVTVSEEEARATRAKKWRERAARTNADRRERRRAARRQTAARTHAEEIVNAALET